MIFPFNATMFAEVVYEAIKKTAEDANRDLSSSSFLIEEDSSQAVRQVQQQRDGCHVLLLCAPTPDAVCATRMLCQLLLADSITHRVRPVAGYSDIKREISRSTESSIVLVGCGVSILPLPYLQPLFSPLTHTFLLILPFLSIPTGHSISYSSRQHNCLCLGWTLACSPSQRSPCKGGRVYRNRYW